MKNLILLILLLSSKVFFANTITLTSAIGTDNQSACLGNPITNIVYNTTGSTGATCTGLPAGITMSIAGDTIIISGTTTVSGLFNYIISTTGGGSTATSTGAINCFAYTSYILMGNQYICDGGTTQFSSPIAGGTWSSNDNSIATVNAAGLIRGIAAGTATITHIAGCTRTTRAVYVNSNLTPAFSFPTSISIGDPVSVLPSTSDNGITGTWSPCCVDNSNIGSTNFVFTPNAGQCCFPYSFLLVVTSVAAPTGSSTQTMLVGNTLADLAVVGTNIVWYAIEADATADTNRLANNTVLVNGSTYYARQTTNGYRSSTSLVVTVTTVLTTDNFELQNINIYPNPATNILNIEFANENISSLEITDMLGKQIKSIENVGVNKTNFDVSSFAKGIYLVTIKTESGIKQIKKLVVE